jgi:hypothetical protein
MVLVSSPLGSTGAGPLDGPMLGFLDDLERLAKVLQEMGDTGDSETAGTEIGPGLVGDRLGQETWETVYRGYWGHGTT